MKIKTLLITGIIMLASVCGSFAQNGKINPDLANKGKWILNNRKSELIDYKNKKALRLNGENGSGTAVLRNYEFQDGIIEVDIAAIPKFTGIVFRVQDKDTYEGIYFRPQNSRHDDPVKRGYTVQYIAEPEYPWHRLRKESPNKYEGPVDLPPDEWFHVKLVISGLEVKVFVNESDSPCLVVKDMKHGLSKGSVGVWCGNTSGGTFSNFTILPSKGAGSKTGKQEKVSYTPEQEYLFDIFKNRRSVRKFKSTPVPEAHIEKILDIARCAPTSGNQQPWKFFVIQDRKKLEELKDKCIQRRIIRAKSRGITDAQKLKETRTRAEKYFGDYLSAPVYVVVLVDSNSTYPSYNRYDGSLAGGYLMIAARALGYGTVFSQDSVPYELIKEVFGIPAHYERICFTPVGVPVEWPEPKNKKELEEFVVYDRFIPGVNYKPPVIRKEITLEPGILKHYTGKYQLNPQMTLTVTTEGSRIFVQATGQMKIEIFPVSETEFFLKAIKAEITFVKDNNGKVTELIFHQGGRDTPAKKIE